MLQATMMPVNRGPCGKRHLRRPTQSPAQKTGRPFPTTSCSDASANRSGFKAKSTPILSRRRDDDPRHQRRKRLVSGGLPSTSMRNCRPHDFLFVKLPLVVINDAVHHHLPAFDMPVHIPREPEALRRPQAC